MNRPHIYLAGPITGCTFDGCTEWRDGFAKALDNRAGIKGLSPMRAKDYLREGDTVEDHYAGDVLSSQRGIVGRDYWDTRRADLVLANLLGADRVSIGTVMEIAWAHAHRVPVVLVMEPEGNVHDHAMLREVCAFRVPTLESALDTCIAILGAYAA